MAALNCGKSTGSAASLDAVMDVVSKHIPSWDIAYLCEVDAFGYEHELFSSSAHSVHRHYLGLGSWAMALEFVMERVGFITGAVLPLSV